MSAEKNYLISIQYLRALAALMVVIHHARNSQNWLFNPLEGYEAFAWGVDIFFVISGFIIYVAARNERPFDFLGRRIIRVVPLYWAATFALLAVKTKLHFWKIDPVSLNHLLQSLFFIPHYDPNNPEQIWPYLVPGWTLNYEMLFYLIFFVGIMLQRTLLFTSITIISLFTIRMYYEPTGAIMEAYTSPILLEFLCGIWIGYAHLQGAINNKNMAWILLAGFVGLFLLPLLSDKALVDYGRIVIATMIVLGAVSLGKGAPHSKLLKLLGDASYSIYLSHIITIVYIRRIWKQLPVDGWPQFSGWIIFALIASSAVGVIIYWCFERPMLKWLRTKWRSYRNTIDKAGSRGQSC